jgi:hypothetical protein
MRVKGDLGRSAKALDWPNYPEMAALAKIPRDRKHVPEQKRLLARIQRRHKRAIRRLVELVWNLIEAEREP